MSKRTSIGLQNKGGVRNDSNREQKREEKLKQERKVLWGREREKDRETEGE